MAQIVKSDALARGRRTSFAPPVADCVLVFIEQSQMWFDSIWTTVAREVRR